MAEHFARVAGNSACCTGMSATDIPGVKSHPSSYSVDETLQRVERVVNSRGLTIFARFDHSGEAARAGLSMRPAQVLVFGNPRAGTPLMQASPLIALELPLKVLVWQDADGRVWVSYSDPSFIANRYTIPSDLGRVLAAVEGVVETALQRTESSG
jgi:uncharacterized protein (DUF302 family)